MNQYQEVVKFYDYHTHIKQKNYLETIMFYQNFLVPMETYYQSSLEKCIREGLIKENGDRYCLTDFGIDVSNRVFAEFI